jgi:DNA-binding response OmpR family regulator
MPHSQQNLAQLPPSPLAIGPQPSTPSEVLLIDSEATIVKLVPLLRCSYRVVVSATVAAARPFVQRNSADVIVTDIELPDGTAMHLCREAKTLPKPPAVLVTTEQVHRVPEALEAHCDGILLKPFAPNLLFARIGRILRARARNTARLNSTEWATHRVWQDMRCPHCELHGVTSFEFASHRRAWFACRQCKKVWLGKRPE